MRAISWAIESRLIVLIFSGFTGQSLIVLGVSAFVDFGVKVGAVEVVGGEDVMVFLVALVRFESGQIN